MMADTLFVKSSEPPPIFFKYIKFDYNIYKQFLIDKNWLLNMNIC